MIKATAPPAAAPPDLTGRTARCTYYDGRKSRGAYSSSSCDAGRDAAICRCTRPSSPDLAFFEFCGAGSRAAALCTHCGYAESAHTEGRCPKTARRRPAGTHYRAQGGQPFDTFYCGCHGWD